MAETDFDQLRDRLHTEFTTTPRLAAHADALARLAEPYVILTTPSEYPPNVEHRVPRYAHLADEMDKRRAALADHRAWVKAELTLGASRAGYVPDLPPGVAWPEVGGRLLTFLAQIDLAATPTWGGSPLPADGWLYVFAVFATPAELGEQPWRLVVTHHRGPREALVRAAEPAADEVWAAPFNTEPEVPTLRLVPVSARAGLTINAKRLPPELSNLSDYALDAAEKAIPLYQDREADWEGVGYLLGYVPEVDEPDDATAHEHAAGGDWVCLMAMLNAGSIYWGDGGRLYLLIRPDDLPAEDFSRVRMVLGCS